MLLHVQDARKGVPPSGLSNVVRDAAFGNKKRACQPEAQRRRGISRIQSLPAKGFFACADSDDRSLACAREDKQWAAVDDSPIRNLMNAVIACGGTGGHLFPGLAV